MRVLCTIIGYRRLPLKNYWHVPDTAHCAK
nr:MAG TPA: hypothetical protein [Microviridae sp.]